MKKNILWNKKAAFTSVFLVIFFISIIAAFADSIEENQGISIPAEALVSDIQNKVADNGENAGGSKNDKKGGDKVNYVFIPGPDLGTKIITVEVDVKMKTSGSNSVVEAADNELERYESLMVTGEDGGLDFEGSARNLLWEEVKKHPGDALEVGAEILSNGGLTNTLLNYTGSGGGEAYDAGNNPYLFSDGIFSFDKKYSVDYLTGNTFYVYENNEPLFKSGDNGKLYNVNTHGNQTGVFYEFVKSGGSNLVLVYTATDSTSVNNEEGYYAAVGGLIPSMLLDPENNSIKYVTTMKSYAQLNAQPVSVTVSGGKTLELYERSGSYNPGSVSAEQLTAQPKSVETKVSSLKISDDGKTVFYSYDFGFDFTEHTYNIMMMDKRHIVLFRDGYPWMVNNLDYEMKYLFPSGNQSEAYYHFDLENHDYDAEFGADGTMLILRDGFPWAVSGKNGVFDFVFLKQQTNSGGPSYQVDTKKEDKKEEEKEVAMFKWNQYGPSIQLVQSDSDSNWVLVDSGKPSVVFSKSEDGKSYDTSYVYDKAPDGGTAKQVSIKDTVTGEWKTGFYYEGGTSAPKNDYGTSTIINPASFVDSLLLDSIPSDQKGIVKIGDSNYIEYEGKIDLDKLVVAVNEQGYPVIKSSDKIYTIEVAKEGVNAEKDVKGKIQPHVIYTDKKTGMKYDSITLTDAKTGKKEEIVFQNEPDPETMKDSQNIYAGDIVKLFEMPDTIQMEIEVDYPTANINKHGESLIEDALEDMTDEVRTYGRGGGNSDPMANVGYGRGGEDSDGNGQGAPEKKTENQKKTSGSNTTAAGNAGLTTNNPTYEIISMPDAILETARTFAAQAMFGDDADASDWGGGKTSSYGRGGGNSDPMANVGYGRGGELPDVAAESSTSDFHAKQVKEKNGEYLTLFSPEENFYIDKDGYWTVSPGSTLEGLSANERSFFQNYVVPDFETYAKYNSNYTDILGLDDQSFEEQAFNALSNELVPRYIEQGESRENLSLTRIYKYDPSVIDSSDLKQYYMDFLNNLSDEEKKDPNGGKYNIPDDPSAPEFQNLADILAGNMDDDGTYFGENGRYNWLKERLGSYYYEEGNRPADKVKELGDNIYFETLRSVMKKYGYETDGKTNEQLQSEYDNLGIALKHEMDAELKDRVNLEKTKINDKQVNPDNKSKIDYLYKSREEQKDESDKYQEPSKWPILDTLQNALTNVFTYLFSPQPMTESIAGTINGITRGVAVSLIPLAIILSITVMMRYGASSPGEIAKTRERIIQLMLSVGLCISSYYIIQNVFKASRFVAEKILGGQTFVLGNEVFNFTGDGGGFVSFLFAVLVVFLLLLLLAEVYISAMAMQVQYVALSAYSPLMLIMSAYEPLNYMRGDWFKKLVHAMIIAPANAIVIRVMNLAVLQGSNNLATAVIKVALYLGAGSIMVVLNASVIKEMFGGIAAMFNGAKTGLSAATSVAHGGASAAKWAANTRLGQAAMKPVSNALNGAKSYFNDITGKTAAGGAAAAILGASALTAGKSKPAPPEVSSSTPNAFTGFSGSSSAEKSEIPGCMNPAFPKQTASYLRPQTWKTSSDQIDRDAKKQAAASGAKEGTPEYDKAYNDARAKLQTEADKKDTLNKEKAIDNAAKKVAAARTGAKEGTPQFNKEYQRAKIEAEGVVQKQENKYNTNADPNGTKLKQAQASWDSARISPAGTYRNAQPPKIQSSYDESSKRHDPLSKEEYAQILKYKDQFTHLSDTQIQDIASLAHDIDVSTTNVSKKAGFGNTMLNDISGSTNAQKNENFASFIASAAMKVSVNEPVYNVINANGMNIDEGARRVNNYGSGRNAADAEKIVVGILQGMNGGPRSLDDMAKNGFEYLTRHPY